MSENNIIPFQRDDAAIERFRVAVGGVIAKNLPPDTISITAGGGLVVSKDCNPDDLREAALKLRRMGMVNAEQRKLIDRYIGQAICSYAALTDCEWAQAISDMGLVQDTGKPYKALIKLSRIAALLPDSVYDLPGLTTNHLEAATSFCGPEDPEHKAKFNEQRVEILRHASENPEERARSWVASEMRKLQKEYNVSPGGRASLAELRKAFETCSQALLEWNDEDYDTFGVTRHQLRDRWDGYKADLVDKGILSDNTTDPLTFTLPWRTEQQPSQVEVIDVETVEPETPPLVA